MRKRLSTFLLFIFLSFLQGVQGEYQAKDFSYLLGKTPGLSADLLSMHFTLYRGYVKSANDLSNQVKEMREAGKDKAIEYGAIERRLAWEIDGAILHELYFENLGGQKSLVSKDSLYEELTKEFGSFSAWKSNFMATGLIRGIGWVILYRDPLTNRLRNIWVDEHHMNHLAGGTPILVMDVWEHAYITEYKLNRLGYIRAFFNNINWDVVKARFKN